MRPTGKNLFPSPPDSWEANPRRGVNLRISTWRILKHLAREDGISLATLVDVLARCEQASRRPAGSSYVINQMVAENRQPDGKFTKRKGAPAPADPPSGETRRAFHEVLGRL